LRDSYDDVQVLGFYDSPEDYVAGNLQSSKFESVEEETPFEGNMNIQYNQDLDMPDIPEDDSEMSEESLYKEVGSLKISTKLAEKTSRASSRLS